MGTTETQKRKIEAEEGYRAEMRGKLSQEYLSKSSKSKNIAGLLAIFFGYLGLHKFYLGKATLGLVYLFFSWTFIPMILGILEGLIYLLMSDQEFQKKYS